MNSIAQFLDKLFEIVERAGILVAVGLAIYIMAQLFFTSDDPAQTRSGKALALLNDNWKAALLIMLPVFYRSLREFIRRVRGVTAGGVGVSFASPAEVDPPAGPPPEPDSRG